MSKECNIAPFGMTGTYPIYVGYLMSSLWASLAGYEKMQTVYTFDGEIDVVTGFTNEPLFEGVDYVNAPLVERMQITSENGYLVSDMVERYYALSFLEIAQKEGWFSEDSYKQTVTHLNAQERFMLNGVGNYEQVGMLIEGNGWYNEAEAWGTLERYEKIMETPADSRRFAWMSLPVTLTETVDEGNGRAATLLDMAHSYVLVNSNIGDNAATVAAIKNFLRFLYSDSELCKFTESTGAFKAVEYDVPETVCEELNYFGLSILNAKKQGGQVLFAASDNELFLKNIAGLRIKLRSPVMLPIFNGGGYNIFQALRENRTASEIFAGSRYSWEDWQTLLNGAS